MAAIDDDAPTRVASLFFAVIFMNAAVAICPGKVARTHASSTTISCAFTVMGAAVSSAEKTAAASEKVDHRWRMKTSKKLVRHYVTQSGGNTERGRQSLLPWQNYRIVYTHSS